MPGGRDLFSMFVLFIPLAVAVAADDGPTAPAPAPGPPLAESKPVEELLAGHKIIDPYRWLEDASSADSEKWVSEEEAYTRSILDPLAGRGELRRRLGELLSIGTLSAPQLGGPYYFYTRREGDENQPRLLVREGLKGGERVLVDVNRLASDGTVALDWWVPSEDGKYVAYGTSPNGSEISTLHVIETSTGALLHERIEQTRAASIAWMLDDSGFYYTRYPKKGEVPPGQEVYHRHVFYHRLGADPTRDPLIFGQGRDPTDSPDVALSNDGRWLIIIVEQGWTKTELFLEDLKARTGPMRITEGQNFIYYATILNDTVFILTNEGAPHYRVLRASLGAPQRAHWEEIIPPGDAVLEELDVVDGLLLAQYEHNAHSQLKLFDLQGKLLGEVSMPAIGSVFGVGGKWNRKEVFFAFHSFTIPDSVYQIHLPDRETSLWTKVEARGIEPSDYEVKQLWFRSKDGTRVPMFVFHRKGLRLDGRNPTLLTGYGGFNLSLTPNFVAERYLWLEHGGVFAVANLRGGAEFGEDWHRAGMLGNKQNVFDDFFAAAEFLIAQGYTDSAHLAIRGGSNGGLLVGAAFTQRPELFRAVVCQVPLLDMLRYQHFQIAKLWIPEYGSSDDPQQFAWLYAYSPYHHVKEGTGYPAILFMTGDTDTRVDPMHAKKMTALMQAKAANGRSRECPILLRMDTKAGHGAGKPRAKQIEDLVDIDAFLFWQLGMK